MEIDFFGDAPALRNEFKVWLTSGFFEGSTVADAPDWFHAGEDKKALPRSLRKEYDRVTNIDLLAMCFNGNGTVSVQILRVTEAGYHQWSDEAVESIGKEDYVRMVACLGQHTTEAYFEKRNGLT